ncbi:MAG: IclR family transcriptional regulator [Bacillota bacterium]
MPYELKTLERALDILLRFDIDHPEWGVTELHRVAGVPKSVVARVLGVFEAHGLLKQDPITRKYRLGIRLFELGRLVVDQMDLRKAAVPVMSRLAQLTGETILLCIEDDYQQVCIESVSSRQNINLASRPGTRIPLHGGASAKVLLAFMPLEERRKCYDKFGLPSFTPYTPTDEKDLEAQLQTIRQCGYAVTFEERDLGTAGVSAPIADYTGQVIASLSVVGLRPRFTDERIPELVRLVTETARAISKELGGPGLGRMTHEQRHERRERNTPEPG